MKAEMPQPPQFRGHEAVLLAVISGKMSPLGRRSLPQEMGKVEGRMKNAEVAAQLEHRLVSGVPVGRLVVSGPIWSLSQREL
jgi:hypothetical protein